MHINSSYRNSVALELAQYLEIVNSFFVLHLDMCFAILVEHDHDVKKHLLV
jgi:hypothetical protein